MSFRQFEELLGSAQSVIAADQRVPVNVKYGCKYDVNFSYLSAGKANGERKGAYFSNLATQLGVIQPEIVEDIDIFDGVNAEVIDEGGKIDSYLLNKHLTSLFDYDRRTANNRVEAILNNMKDNSISVIYNMLRMFYLRKLQTEKPNLTIRKSDTYYDDGHLSVLTGNMFHGMEEKKISDVDFDGIVNEVPINITHTNIYPKPGYFVNPDMSAYAVSGEVLSQKTIGIIRLALSPFPDTKIPLRILHASPRLTSQLDLFNTKQSYVRGPSPTLRRYTAKDYYDAIYEYVNSHRLHSHFNMAYIMLCQTMYTHKPRSAEALIWNAKKETIRMPKAYSVRGMLGSMLGGEAFVLDTNMWSTFINWLSTPYRTIIHSIALSEAVHCSTFDYVTRRRVSGYDELVDNESERDFMYGYVGPYNKKECGIIKEFHLLALRYQRDIKLPWATRIGLLRYDWFENLNESEILKVDINLLDETALLAYPIDKTEVIVGEQEVRTTYGLILDTIPPCCYPVLSMEINQSEYYMNQTEIDTSMEYDRAIRKYVTKETKVIHKMMGVLRLAGWDCVVKRRSDQKLFNNWASNSNGHYLPMFQKNYSIDETYEMAIADIKKRKYSWLDISSYGSTISIKARLELLCFSVHYDGENMPVPMLSYTPRTVDERVIRGKKAPGELIKYVEYKIEKPDKIKEYEDFMKVERASNPVPLANLQPIHVHVPTVQEWEEMDVPIDIGE